MYVRKIGKNGWIRWEFCRSQTWRIITIVSSSCGRMAHDTQGRLSVDRVVSCQMSVVQLTLSTWDHWWCYTHLSSTTATVSSELCLVACSVTRTATASSTSDSYRDMRIQAPLRHIRLPVLRQRPIYQTTSRQLRRTAHVSDEAWWLLRTDGPVCGQCSAGCQYPLILPLWELVSSQQTRWHIMWVAVVYHWDFPLWWCFWIKLHITYFIVQ